MVDAALLSRAKTLSPAERLARIGAVWETLSPADAPVTAEETILLDARLAELDNSPEDQSPWSAVQARLRRQLPWATGFMSAVPQSGIAPIPLSGLASRPEFKRHGYRLYTWPGVAQAGYPHGCVESDAR